MIDNNAIAAYQLRACLKSPDQEPFLIPTADAQLRRRGFSLCPN